MAMTDRTDVNKMVGPKNSEDPKRVLFIGLDGLIPELVQRFVAEGNLPTIGQLMQQGVFAHLLSSPPVDTPTNWTSLATGAWTGTHGINTFSVRKKGEVFDNHRDFSANIFPRFPGLAKNNLNQVSGAEYLWQAAERAGKQCLLINYPGGWPSNLHSGVIVDGTGPYSSVLARLTHPCFYATSGAEPAKTGPAGSILLYFYPLEQKEPGSQQQSPGSNPAGGKPIQESALVVSGEAGLERRGEGWVPSATEGDRPDLARLSYRLLLRPGKSGDYERLTLSGWEQSDEAQVELLPGQWSDWLFQKFETPYGETTGKFRFRLLELAPDGSRVVLYRTAIYNNQGWTYPAHVADQLIDALFELSEAVGLHPQEVTSSRTQVVPKVSPLCQVYESTADQAVSLAATAEYLAKKYPWDLMMVQIHAPDGLHHDILNGLCREWKLYTPAREQETLRLLREEYQILDHAVAELVQSCADESTALVVVSDHGAIPTIKTLWLARVLMDAGLLSYRKNEEGQMVIDYEKSRVILGDHPLAQNIWVNLKGREPFGIVEPEEYERIRSQVIQLFYGLRDPETGECPIAMVLRTEDAAFLGQWGDTVGDLVYYYAPGYANKLAVRSVGPFDPGYLEDPAFEIIGEGIPTQRGVPLQGVHQCYLPGTKYSGCSVQGVLILAGPGIREGVEIKAPVWTVDVTPTVSRLLGINPPKQAEGKVISTALVEA
ncbi:MAG: alkaline phosphatase family protein [Desulfitobacteriaceae bacterium]